VLICYNIAHIAQVIYYGVIHIHYFFQRTTQFFIVHAAQVNYYSQVPITTLM